MMGETHFHFYHQAPSHHLYLKWQHLQFNQQHQQQQQQQPCYHPLQWLWENQFNLMYQMYPYQQQLWYHHPQLQFNLYPSGGVTPMRKSSNQHDHDTNMLPTPISSSVSISTSNTLKEEFPLPKRRRGSTNHDINTVLEFQCLECDFHTQDREIIREHCKRGNQAWIRWENSANFYLYADIFSFIWIFNVAAHMWWTHFDWQI